VTGYLRRSAPEAHFGQRGEETLTERRVRDTWAPPDTDHGGTTPLYQSYGTVVLYYMRGVSDGHHGNRSA
jgi:hypothetical protein